jgi:hypothetical protein
MQSPRWLNFTNFDSQIANRVGVGYPALKVIPSTTEAGGIWNIQSQPLRNPALLYIHLSHSDKRGTSEATPLSATQLAPMNWSME